MATDQQLGPSNALLRRVQRYAHSSTLFRAADAPLDRVAKPNQPRITQTVTKAIIQSKPSSLPIGQTVAGPDKPAVSPSSTPTPFFPSPPPPAVMPAAPAESTTVTPEVVEPTVRKSDFDNDEVGWRRLQGIMHRHEAGKGFDSEPSPPSSPAPENVSRAIAAAEKPSWMRQPEPRQEDSAVPLERAWPVQSSEPIQRLPQETSSSTQPVKPLAPPDPQQERRIRGRLDAVTAGRPTDSSIEYHLPSRPRPAVPEAPSVKAKPLPPWISKKEAPASEAQPSTEPETIPTEIGPLPADMWDYLGETPPRPAQHTPAEHTPEAPSPSSAEPSSTDSDAILRAIAAAETPTDSSTPAPQQPKSSQPTDETIFEQEPETVEPTVAPSPDPDEREMRAIETAESPAEQPSAAADPSAATPEIQRQPEVTTGGQPDPVSPLDATMAEALDARQPDRAPVTENTTPAPSDAVMRAIAAAEAPSTPSPESPAARPSPDPVSESASAPDTGVTRQSTVEESETTLPTRETQPSEPVMPAVDVPEKPATQLVTTELDRPADSSIPLEPEISPPAKGSASEASVIRAIAAAEAPAQPAEPETSTSEDEPAEPSPSPTSRSEPPATGSASEASVMRAIAAAETPSRPSSSETVSPGDEPFVTAAAQDTSHPDDRAAIEPTVDENVPPSPSSASEPETPSPGRASEGSVMRAIAAAEAPLQPPAPVDTPTAVIRPDSTTAVSSGITQPSETSSPPGIEAEKPSPGRASEESIMRAVAAAEAPSMPKPESTPAPDDPSTPGAPSRTVASKPGSTHVPPAGIQPQSASSRAQSVATAPTTTPGGTTPTDRIMRAIATAEAPVAPTGSPAAGREPRGPTPTLESVPEGLWRVSRTPSAGPTAAVMPPSTATMTPPIVQTADESDAVMRAIAAAEAPSIERRWPTVKSSQRDLPQVSKDTPPQDVQRFGSLVASAVDPIAEPMVSDIGSGLEESLAEETTPPPEIDIDELAQEVYAQLRRRLDVDWERGRGRW